MACPIGLITSSRTTSDLRRPRMERDGACNASRRGDARAVAGGPVTDTAQIQLPPTARSVPAARRHVLATLDEWHLEALRDVAALLTSEIVTNAVLHARTDVTVTVEREDDAVRVSVADGSPVAPALRHHSDTATTGRGLRLIQNLADAWSVDADADGKTVWFRLSTAPGGAQVSTDSDSLEGAGA
jgi:anti-sigma regulatory factor (Ser/Thr protein kinase)